MYNRKYKRITRYLLLKLVLAVVFCLITGFLLSEVTDGQNAKTIAAVGDTYMHSIGKQIMLHLETVIHSQCNKMIDLFSEKNIRNLDRDERKEWLAEGAQIRHMEYLAFCSADGKLDVIYGDAVELNEATSFLEYLRAGNRAVTSGDDASGNRLMLIGLPGARIPLENEPYIGVIAGVSIEYVNETLELNISESEIYSHIICGDGRFVIRNGDVKEVTYFQRILENVYEGAAKCVEEIRAAMQDEKHYSAVLRGNGSQCHIHIAKIPQTEWFLVVVMPYSSATTNIIELSRYSKYLTYSGCVVILLVFIWVFWSYSRELRKLMIELDTVRQDAVNANKSKSEFLSNMSHDIRTPMNAIIGMASIATANSDNKEQVQNCLKKITMSSNHLLGLINDVLDISKIESGKLTLTMEPISLQEVIENVVTIIQPQAEGKDQDFDVMVHDIYAEDVCCDAIRLNQILINILGNAVKFTPAGGSIRISIYEEESARENRVIVHFVVKDTGIGMTKEFQEKLFDSFSRVETKQVRNIEGSGLGMAITKYIVDALGGDIEVQSELGEGTCFHITLELEKAQGDKENMLLPNWRTLIIDADQQICENTVHVLHDLGIDADWALDAESAMKAIAQKHGTPEEYKILLVDCKLPKMHGAGFAREIRMRYGEEIKVVLICGCNWNSIETEAVDAGVTGFISKPLFKSTLFQRLKPLILGQIEAIPSGFEEEQEEDFSGKRILLVEDNELNMEIAKEIISCMGLEVDTAENGQIGLDKFQQSAAGYYDAILMDVRMPVMSGYEASRAIRALERADAQTVPIIAMTADVFSEDIEECLENGMNAHIAKPIEMDIIRNQMKKFLM